MLGLSTVEGSIGPIFRQHRRTVRDIAARIGKRARLEIHGADAELDTGGKHHRRVRR